MGWKNGSWVIEWGKVPILRRRRRQLTKSLGRKPGKIAEKGHQVLEKGNANRNRGTRTNMKPQSREEVVQGNKDIVGQGYP